MNASDILLQPIVTESVIDLIESENKLAFKVALRANKQQIRWAVETLYKVKVIKINTLISPTGEKKAFVKLSPDDDAGDLATKLGIF